MAERIAGGEFLDPNNPILQGGISAVTAPILRNLQESILPQITDEAIKGGAYGGTSQALRETQAARDYELTAGETGGKMTLDWLSSRFGDIFNTPGLFNAANSLDLAPGTALSSVGAQEFGIPWEKYLNYGKSFGFAPQGTKTTGTYTGAAPDMATQLLQGGLGGLSTLSSLGTAFPSTMGAIGGGISSAFPMIFAGLSDRRFKTDVSKVGALDNGLPVYRYRFKGERAFRIGVMADEVEEVNPEAVHTTADGVKFVDYLRATET
jgi:hypothetical protein